MPIFFSPSAVAFFDDDIHVAIPSDALPISAELHTQIFDEQAAGRIIAAGPDGQPVTVTPPPPTDDQLLTHLRRRRNRLLSACDYTQIPDFVLTDEQREAWRDYRQSLRDLPETITDLANVEWPAPPTA